MKLNIGLVDDHQLFLKSLTLLLKSFEGFEVVMEACNGKDLQEKLKISSALPHIMLIDVEMPVMNGVETAKWLHQAHPTIKLVALSMNDKEQTVIDMIKAGCCSYLLKDTHPDELESALKEIHEKNYYNSWINKTNLLQLLLSNQTETAFQISEQEREFLQLATSDLTYKQIADAMNLSGRTIDGYRESLFTKLHAQSRTGMVLEAIRRGLVKV
jgi:DNA-binding NarL/FixJ family response regulator